MEKKNVQRIIGIIVIIALVVIIMPVLFGRNDLSTQEAANLKAPPFADEQQTIASAADSADVSSTASTTANTSTMPSQQELSVAGSILEPVSANVAEAAHDIPAPASLTSSTPQPQNAPAKTNTASVTPGMNVDNRAVIAPEITNANTNKVTTEDKSVPVEHEANVTAQNNLEKINSSTKKDNVSSDSARIIKTAKTAKMASHKKTVVSHANKLKSPAWAVQIGSFKVKQNAVQLTNKLRAAGYRAFTREIKSASGHSSTRVYIGPEFKQTSAIKLAKQVQNNLNMPGIVISYQPLEL
ncbi:MAG: DedD protein [uncultured bacterium]|nr:MAG: DedD protein [uncultured bacterium]